MFLLIFGVNPYILVVTPESRRSAKFDTLSTFFNNAFSIFKAKHDVSKNIIMYCSFRAVVARQQEIIDTQIMSIDT